MKEEIPIPKALSPTENKEVVSSATNKQCYRAIKEFIDTENRFLKEVWTLLALCDYKFQKIKRINSAEILRKSQTFKDLTELITVLDQLYLPIKELFPLSKKLEQISIESNQIKNELSLEEITVFVEALSLSFTTGSIHLKFNAILFYSINFEKYQNLINLLFSNEKPEILYDLLRDEKYLEKIKMVTYSYRSEGFEMTQSDLYENILAPVLHSALIAPIQRGPRYPLLISTIYKYSPLKLKEKIYKIKIISDSWLERTNESKRIAEKPINCNSRKPPPVPEEFKQRRQSLFARTSINLTEISSAQKPRRTSYFPIRNSTSTPVIGSNGSGNIQRFFKIFSHQPLRTTESHRRHTIFGAHRKPPPLAPLTLKGRLLFPISESEEQPKKRPPPIKNSLSDPGIPHPGFNDMRGLTHVLISKK